MFPFWDFTVGMPWKYAPWIWVRDTLTYIGGAPAMPGWMSGDPLRPWLQPDYDIPQGRPLFLSGITVGHTSSARYDTLWLRSHDYAAHCLVTPILGGGSGKEEWHMGLYRLHDGRRFWTLTVPYDYDGYADAGLNYGDGMNDLWEESGFGVTDTWPIRPFVTVGHRRGPTDFDPVPVGREIDGDSWCNFAEYRGVIVRLDSTFHQPTEWCHRRLDPLRKTVLVHVRNNLTETRNQMVLDQMPGYIYKLWQPSQGWEDTVEIWFTDSIRFRRDKTPVEARFTEDEDTRIYVVGRDVNFNRAGAGLWYYGFGSPIRKPMEGDDTIRAVVHWKWDTREPAGTALGRNYNYPRFWSGHDSASVPDQTSRIVVNIDRYLEIQNSVQLYRDSPDVWLRDFSNECKRTIAHEFGHSIGMFDRHSVTTLHTMMDGYCWDTTRGFIPASNVYHDSSKGQFSVKEQTP